MGDSLLWDDFPSLVYRELVLAANWVDFGSWDVADAADGKGDAVA